LKSLFPGDEFEKDAKRCGGFTALARAAGVARSQVLQWPKPAGAAARAKNLEKVLSLFVAKGIDTTPYQPYLMQAKAETTEVCRDCGREKPIRRGRVTQALHQRSKGILPRPCLLPDGRLERLCKTCAARRILRKGYFDLAEFNENVPAAFVPEKDRWAFATDEDDDEDDPVLARAKRDYPGPAERQARRAAIRRRAWRTVLNTPGAKGLAETVDEFGREFGGRTLATIEADARKREREKYQKIRRKASAPKSETHKRNIGVAHVVLGRITNLALCLLCGLLVHGRRWHKRCWMRWLHWCRRNRISSSTPPPTRRGRPADENLGRNYRFLLSRLVKSVSPQEILEDFKQEIAAYGNRRRSSERMASRTTIPHGIQSLLRVLPGSWDLVSSPGGYRIPEGQDRSYVGAAARAAVAAQRHRADENTQSGSKHWKTAKERREIRRQANQYLQDKFPLPARLQQFIESRARDALVAQLHFFGMPVGEIIELTGVPEPQVKAVIANPLRAEVAVQLTAWLERVRVATRRPPLPMSERITVETFPAWLKGLPAREGLTWKDVARRAGLAVTTVRRMRAGREFHASTLTKLFQAFGAPAVAEEVIALLESAAPRAPGAA
jgi:hypothetical protein